MSTGRNGRTPVESNRTTRPKFIIWIDYLLDHDTMQILDDNNEPILVFGDSGYEELDVGTVRTPRPSI